MATMLFGQVRLPPVRPWATQQAVSQRIEVSLHKKPTTGEVTSRRSAQYVHGRVSVTCTCAIKEIQEASNINVRTTVRFRAKGRFGMDVKDLKYFVAVYEAKGFLRAASALGTVQSNVSTRIRSLEKFVGVPLFERRYRGIVPTEKGEKLYAHAK